MAPRAAPRPRAAPTGSTPDNPAADDPSLDNSVADDDYDPSRQHSRMRLDPNGLEQSQNTADAVHPYVEQDLQDSVKVELYPWVEAVFGCCRERIDKWTSEIGEQRWFHDDVIQQHLKSYCDAREEPDRYGPFCALANRILDLARSNLLDESHPTNSLRFLPTSRRMVSRTPEHGKLGAIRYLDVTLTHEEAAHRFKKDKRIAWVDVLHYVELKFVKRLTSALAAQKKGRESTSGKQNTARVRRSFSSPRDTLM